MERHKDICLDKEFDSKHFNMKAKYQQNEQDQITERQIGKDFHRVCNVERAKAGGISQNTLLLRHYNDGRHGGWNNYAAYSHGPGQASYVKTEKFTKNM